MMGVYIPGMEMPKAPDGCRAYMDLRIWDDTTIEARIGPKETEYKAIPIPPHVRLLWDKHVVETFTDAILAEAEATGKVRATCDEIISVVADVPTIIPADED